MSHAQAQFLLGSLTFLILTTIATPRAAQAFCDPPVEAFWLSVEDAQEVSRADPIWVAHSRSKSMRVMLNGEELEPVEAHSFYSRYAQPESTTLGDANLEIQLEPFYPGEETQTIQVRYEVTDAIVHNPPGLPVILSASEMSEDEKTVCSDMFYRTGCWDDIVPVPYKLELSNQPSAFLIQRSDDSSQWQDLPVLWPSTCSPVLNEHELLRNSCYRIVVLDESGRRTVGDSTCDLLNQAKSDSPSSCSTSNDTPSSTERNLVTLLLGWCLLGLRRRPRVSGNANQRA